MSEHVAGGPDVCSVADAAQDVYLSLMIRRAIEAGDTVVTDPQGWA